MQGHTWLLKQSATTTSDPDLIAGAFPCDGTPCPPGFFLYLPPKSFCILYLVCDKMLPLTFTYPSWLPGFLCYAFLLVINTILPLITMIALEDVATGLEIALVVLNSSASIVIVAMFFYKMFLRSCVFNKLKYDRKCLWAVAILDAVAAVGWSLRVDRKGICEKAVGHKGSCHTALVAVALVFAWLSAGVAYCAGVYADHAEKKKERSTLPIHLSGRNISNPVVLHAGQFSDFALGEDDDTKFTEIPLRQHGRPTAI